VGPRIEKVDWGEGGFNGVLVGFKEFLALKRMMLQKVLGVGALRRLAILGHHAFPSGGLR
jgi:hypothetical protein